MKITQLEQQKELTFAPHLLLLTLKKFYITTQLAQGFLSPRFLLICFFLVSS